MQSVDREQDAKPPDVSFANYVRKMNGGNSWVVVSKKSENEGCDGRGTGETVR